MSNNRFSDVLDGAKQGAIKKGIDTAVDKVSDPIVAAIKEKLGQDNPMLADLTETAVKFIISLGISEAIAVLGPQIGDAIGRDGTDSVEKAALLSTYMRRYAGERLGAEAIQATMVFLPEILSSFKNIKTEDIRYALGDRAEARLEYVPDLSVASTAEAPSILERLVQEETVASKQK